MYGKRMYLVLLLVLMMFDVVAPMFASADTTTIPRLVSCSAYMERTNAYGSRGFEVEKLQLFLNAYDNGHIPVTGYYGPITTRAVALFAREYGISGDRQGAQGVEVTSVINALYCRPPQGETTGVVSVVPVSSNIPAASMIVGAPVSNIPASLVVIPTPVTSSSFAHTRSTSGAGHHTVRPVATASAASLASTASGQSPIKADATKTLDSISYSDDAQSVSGMLHESVPWLMLIAALLLAYIAWHTYQQQENIDAASSDTPVIVPSQASTMPVVVSNTVSDHVDDLTVLEGIGPAAQKVLNTAGISSFSQLAQKKELELVAIFKKAWPHFNEPALGSWPLQASLARDGKWEALQQYIQALHTEISKKPIKGA